MTGNAGGAVAIGAVIDTNELLQHALAAHLARWNVDVVARSADITRAPVLVQAHDCDLLVVGIGTGSSPDTVYQQLRRVHKLSRTTTTVAVVERLEPCLVEAALAGGAVAAVDRAASVSVVVAEIERVLDDALADGGGAARPRLTRRELQILRLVSGGRSNHAVARLLWVTDQTVKFHLANTYKKLGVQNRAEARCWAVRHGLVTDVVVRGDELAEDALAAV
jgi:DNA-binding NarL/FixJ family response regulator